MLREALDRIAGHASEHRRQTDVLILGRYRHSRPGNAAGLARQYPGLRFSCMTVHRVKGLETDCVVVLGLCSGKYGFPVEIADDPLLELARVRLHARHGSETVWASGTGGRARACAAEPLTQPGSPRDKHGSASQGLRPAPGAALRRTSVSP